MDKIGLSSVLTTLRSKGLAVFEKDSKPYNLNIVAIRNKNAKLDEFGCHLVAFWKHKGNWIFHKWPITTYPGKRYLIEKLLNPRGAAILCPGQYRGAYGIRKHRGKYDALCQTYGPVRVFRDGNRDKEFDLNPSTIMKGWFGINIHRSQKNGCTLRVGAYSAGCQVFKCGNHFSNFMSICYAAKRRFGNKFTFTLINESDL